MTLVEVLFHVGVIVSAIGGWIGLNCLFAAAIRRLIMPSPSCQTTQKQLEKKVDRGEDEGEDVEQDESQS